MGDVLGQSEVWLRVFEQLERVVDVPCPVLLAGPHGSGKHTCARALHRASGAAGSFVRVDSSSADAASTWQDRSALLLDTQPFDARSNPERWMDAALGGTLFIHELTALPACSQVFLERALRSGEPRSGSFRLIAGSTHTPEALLRERLVRPDLFYRVSVLCCTLPDLRERGTDILRLARAFLDAVPDHRTGRQFSAAAERLLLSYTWPGNMSELRSAVQHAAAVATEPLITPRDLPARILSLGLGQPPPVPVLLPEQGIDLRLTLESFENELLRQALDRTGWNKQRAARLLGMNRTTLVEMLKRKRLHPPPGPSA